jgi:hypothetical protein
MRVPRIIGSSIGLAAMAGLLFIGGTVLPSSAGPAPTAPVAPAAAVSAATSGAAYVAVTPFRILDTRPAPDNVGGFVGPLPASSFHSFNVAGVGAIPTNAIAVQLNLTATATTAASYLTVYPPDVVRPTASNLNWTAGGTTVANLVTSKLSADGRLRIFNLAGTTHVIADVVGYYVANTAVAGEATLTQWSDTTSLTPATIGTITLAAPGPGRLLVTVTFAAYTGDQASSGASVMGVASYGLCTTPDSKATCGASWQWHHLQDADSTDAFMATDSVTLTRVITVVAAGNVVLYANAQSGGAYGVGSDDSENLTYAFFPSASDTLPVTGSPSAVAASATRGGNG